MNVLVVMMSLCLHCALSAVKMADDRVKRQKTQNKTYLNESLKILTTGVIYFKEDTHHYQ